MKKTKWEIDSISLFSHELKTPLSSLKLAVSLLEKNFEKNKDMLPLMNSELDKIIDFITDCLDLRFIQEQEDVFQKDWSSFDSLLSGVCSSFQLIAEKEKVQFDIKKAIDEDLELFMDSKWFGCVLENLLSNAIQHSPRNSTIFIEYGQDKGQSFYCSIRDEGPGLKDNKKIFQEFYKQSLNAKEGLKNTGLGLSIAKAIIIAHEGHISASSYSKGSGGSVFYFALPRLRLLKKSA